MTKIRTIRFKKNIKIREAIKPCVKNLFESCALSSYPVHPRKRNSSKREEGGSEGEEEEEGQRTARNWSVSAANEIKRGGSVFESFRELATSTKAAGNTALRPRKGSPHYTIIANKMRTIIVRRKKKEKNSKSRPKSLLYFSLKKKKYQ